MSKFSPSLILSKARFSERPDLKHLPANNSTAVRTLALASAVALVVASAGLGGAYAWSQGSSHGALLGALFVLFAASLECVKPLAVSTALTSFASFKLVRGAALGVLASAAIAYSLTAELGLMAGARGDVVAHRAADADAKRHARERYKRAEHELQSLAPSRPVAELQSTIDGLLQTPGADNCATINGKVTRDVCPKVAELRAELARASRRAQLDEILRHAERDLKAGPAVGAADPAATAVTTYLAALGFAVAPDLVSQWLALVPILALEAGSAFAGLLVQAVSAPRRVGASVGRGDTVKDAPGQELVVQGGPPSEPPAVVDDAVARERVKTAILNQLAERGGSAVASERGLAALIGASKPTVRRAIHGLVIAGLVAAEATRNGTMLRLVA